MLSLFMKLMFYLIRCLPVRLAGALGAGIGRVFFHLQRRHRNIALKNLQRVYPEKRDAWRFRIARESCAELGRTCFELPHVFLRSREFLLSRITIEGETAFKEAMQLNQGVMATACHHSNWELGALSLSMLGYAPGMIYRPIRQTKPDALLKVWRERFGAQLHAREEGLRWLPRQLKQGGCIGFMIDQHLSNGIPIPFLGHMANTTTLPAVFANKYHTPVFGVILHRIGRQFRFRLSFSPITLPDADQTDEIKATQTISDHFAPAIHERPELWLWIHRRWLYLDEQETMPHESA